MKPLISIIIPNFNRGHLLKEVLESVLNQTYQPLEIVVVDDASTDNSIAIIQNLQKSIPNLLLIQQEINSGANACRNLGVDHAKGEYIAFLDSDDYFLPDKLEKQLKVFNQYPEVGFVVTGFGAKTVQVLPEGIIPLKETIFQNNLGGFSTLMVKKSLFLEVGGLDQSLPSCQDWDLFLKLLTVSKGYKVAEDLVIYEVQDDSISKNVSKVVQGYKIVSERARILNSSLELIPEPNLLAYQEYYLAMRYFGLKEIKPTRRHLLQSIKTLPKPVPILYYIASLFGVSSLSYLLMLKKHILTKHS
ncbi:TPA: glycosyltransferase family 2 protein [Streptococcus suis]|nr:glycosyltransferase family 2 protein [Streptococcus suis]